MTMESVQCLERRTYVYVYIYIYTHTRKNIKRCIATLLQECDQLQQQRWLPCQARMSFELLDLNRDGCCAATSRALRLGSEDGNGGFHSHEAPPKLIYSWFHGKSILKWMMTGVPLFQETTKSHENPRFLKAKKMMIFLGDHDYPVGFSCCFWHQNHCPSKPNSWSFAASASGSVTLAEFQVGPRCLTGRRHGKISRE